MNVSNTLSMPVKAMSAGITFLLASACGLIVANLYYAQPLIGLISINLGLSSAAAGLIVTITQVGYVLGMLLIVPLGDLFENRRLVLISIGLAVFALLGAALSQNAWMFLTSSLLIGICSVAVHVLLPYAAHLSPEATRGQAVGNVSSGIMLGIMMARPVSSFVTGLSSWHMIFFLSAGLMIVLWVVLSRKLPVRMPHTQLKYTQLLRSMGNLALHTPILQRRALYHACLFAAFSLFWTTVPMFLTREYNLSQTGIALFALAGVAGAIAAPIAGRLADSGWSQSGTVMAMVMVAGSFLLTYIAPNGTTWGLGLLVLEAILLDFGVVTNLTIGQRAIFALSAEHRSRLNAIYMSIFFMGGAIGSALGGWAFAHHGWSLTIWVGFSFPIIALIYCLTERR